MRWDRGRLARVAGGLGAAGAVAESGGALSPDPTAAQLELLAKLRPQGEAPELLNEVWLNSEPLKLADLRGNVVLIPSASISTACWAYLTI